MKAMICTRYGPPEVLQLKDVAKPRPKDDEVLIKVRAAAVTMSDIYIRGCQVPLRMRIPMRLMLGLTKPRNPVLGEVLAGEIESVGRAVGRFKAGDAVYGLTGFGLGAYAEYKCMRERDSKRGCLALKPAGISCEEATAVAYGGLLASQSIEKGKVRPGQDVLVYGASGTTGTMAVQLAKALGARVTGVCGTAHLELVKTLGADEVIDYTREDRLSPGRRFDLVLDAVGKSRTSKLKEACRKALAPGGTYASIDDGDLRLDSRYLAAVAERVEAGQIKPVIDRCYRLEDLAEAHRYVEGRHKLGGVAVRIA
jgi:NADPH:quinone reductase-like Zn-dependent oxidoreductase